MQLGYSEKCNQKCRKHLIREHCRFKTELSKWKKDIPLLSFAHQKLAQDFLGTSLLPSPVPRALTDPLDPRGATQ